MILFSRYFFILIIKKLLARRRGDVFVETILKIVNMGLVVKLYLKYRNFFITIVKKVYFRGNLLIVLELGLLR